MALSRMGSGPRVSQHNTNTAAPPTTFLYALFISKPLHITQPPPSQLTPPAEMEISSAPDPPQVMVSSPSSSRSSPVAREPADGPGPELSEANLEDGHDKCSTRSNSPSVIYQHEPFSTYQDKVRQLCAAIFSGHDESSLLIERIKGGNYNRIIGITMTQDIIKEISIDWNTGRRESFVPHGITMTHDLIKEISVKWNTGQRESFVLSGIPKSVGYILRIPRDPKRSALETLYDAAILRYARDYVDSRIPDLHSVDASKENAIESPYIIQDRLQGQMLTSIQYQLTTTQLACMAQHMHGVHRKLQGMVSPTAGVLKPWLELSPRPSVIETEKFSVGDLYAPPTHIPAPPQTTKELLLELIERWQAWEATFYQFKNKNKNVWHQFAKIVKHL